MAGGEVARARAALAPIEHIVVLMLENRSFDHKFGYLSLPGHELPDHGELPTRVNGIDPARTVTYAGHTYRHEPLDEAIFKRRDLDPPHDAASVRTQIAGGRMDGFVEAFAAALAAKSLPESRDPGVLKAVLGHLLPDGIPISDHLARNFCLCDNWFCSVPGPTLPNRFFSVAGTTDGILDPIDLVVGRFGKFASLFRHLGEHDWRWYSSDPAILRAIDERYMLDTPQDDHFAYFNEYTEAQPRSFLRDVLGDDGHEPALPPVAWIDPNFAMSAMVPAFLARLLKDGPLSNDDHPPSPSLLGQRLVHTVYRALGESRYWDNTLLVVTYDEHGGFADHVSPPEGHGPRVPVLLVSPHVRRGVCGTQLDHASLIRTILLRFGEEGSWDAMGDRVRAAADLSVALRDDGSRAPYVPVTNPGDADISPADLAATWLPDNGSTLENTLGFDDERLTDLQRDIIRGIAIPLRTGYRFLARARKWSKLLKLLWIFRFVHRRPKHRLTPRSP